MKIIFEHLTLCNVGSDWKWCVEYKDNKA